MSGIDNSPGIHAVVDDQSQSNPSATYSMPPNLNTEENPLSATDTHWPGAMRLPIPTFGPEMEDLFDQLWIKTQRRLAAPVEDEDQLVAEENHIRRQSIQSLIVTSWQTGEGSSTVSLGIAARAALGGRGDILLVDADHGTHQLSSMVGLDSAPGLRQFVRGEASLEESIVRMGMSNLYFLPAGIGASTELNSARGNHSQALARLEERFRYLIFDSQSLKHGVDGYRWGRLIVNSLLVVRAGVARRQTVSHAVTSMRAHGLRVLGVVLNHRVDVIPDWLYRYL